LITVAEALSKAGFWVLRYNMPFRQQGRSGPPRPADAAIDRSGLREAVASLRETAKGRIVLGGHSYGGRQSSMLLAEDPAVADVILLLSYPLHPPRKPEQLRTAHLPNLRTPALFVHGGRDPFGTLDELRAAMQLVPARTHLSEVPRAGHDLAGGKFDISELVTKPLGDLLQ
jgi:uncharacterized protein